VILHPYCREQSLQAQIRCANTYPLELGQTSHEFSQQSPTANYKTEPTLEAKLFRLQVVPYFDTLLNSAIVSIDLKPVLYYTNNQLSK
jgi:hypothetical protein